VSWHEDTLLELQEPRPIAVIRDGNGDTMVCLYGAQDDDDMRVGKTP
jgi:hypothetical protein